MQMAQAHHDTICLAVQFVVHFILCRSFANYALFSLFLSFAQVLVATKAAQSFCDLVLHCVYWVVWSSED